VSSAEQQGVVEAPTMIHNAMLLWWGYSMQL
jgi:hypothetical protein